MEKFKKLKITLISVLLALLLAVSATVLAISLNSGKAYASPYYVELDGNTVFYTPISSDSIISESEPVAKENATEEGATARYTSFKIGDGQYVAYRQNLAYSWISGEKDADGKYTGEGADGKFSIKLSFGSLKFKRFIIKLQSQQYVMTKDGRSENYLIFEPTGTDIYTIKVAQEKDDDGSFKDAKTIGGDLYTFAADERVEISLGEYKGGDYQLVVKGDKHGTTLYSEVYMKNVYEHYATYVSSGDNAVTPLTFSAEFGEDDKNDVAEMLLYDISGQSFEMHERTSGYRVEDTASPVICFSQTPSYLEYGKSIGLQYKVIDVLASSPGATAYYYVLTGEQYKNEGNKFDYDKTDYAAEEDNEDNKEGEGDTDDKEEKQESPFIKVTSSSGARIIRDDKTFIPYDYDNPETYKNVCGLVKLYYELYDRGSTSSTSQKDIVFVNWYAKPEALVNIYDIKKDDAHDSYFLKLIDEKQGVTYAQSADETATREEVERQYKEDVENFRQAYQNAVNDAIRELKYDNEEENGKLYAGGDKFYLPAIETVLSNVWQFNDDYNTARDYKYSIYYKGKTAGSHTSLEANKLAIDLNDADVTYRFTIFITDPKGNPMRYPTIDDDGKLVWKEITTNDIWDEDFADLLPFFEFDVSYRKATAENPKDLSLSYVDTSYSGVSFKITGVSGTYASEYKLYVFDRAEMQSKLGRNLEYDEFNKHLEELFNNTYIDGQNTRRFFTTVKAASELLETDDNYEKFKALNWNATSISFTPQTVDEFYVIELSLTDNRSQSQKTYHATISPSVQTKALKGESEWLENNKTSVILLSIAGACLIALIVLLIIKPKDKGDIDAIYTEVEEKGKSIKKK